MPDVLKVHDARKRFGSVTALEGAEFALGRGELLALLGPNGAGKTTLIRAIAGRVRLDAGRIELLGNLFDGATRTNGEARRQLGIVPQEIALYPLLTSRENLEVFASLQGVAGATLGDRVAWALDWTGLAERADEPIHKFSGGMKRRLNIACGVLHQPEVVLLDEPTVGVDPQSRERIWEMLAKLREAGASLLLTTHQLDEAQGRCDRIVIIDHGHTIASGTFAELVERTVGPHRKITLRLDRPPRQPIARIESDPSGRELRATVTDVAAELPPLLSAIHDAGCRVEDVAVEAPSLQAVFLHLTGRELRE